MSRTGGQEPVGYRIDNPIIPGRFIRNRTQGVGEVTTTVVAFLFIFDFSTFRGGLEKMAEKSESRKIRRWKNVVWQGSISVGLGLDAHGGRGRMLVARMEGTSVAMIERVYGHFRNQSYQEAQARLERERAMRGL